MTTMSEGLGTRLTVGSFARRFWETLIRRQGGHSGLELQPPELDWKGRAFDQLLASKSAWGRVRDSDALDFLLFCAAHADESHSQLFQDLFVRQRLGEKREGFFVEFGATDGISLSNTKCLEERLAWRGILAEPARCWHERLRKNRSGAIDTRCVWTQTGQALSFNEVKVPEFSTVHSFSDKDLHATSRRSGTLYPVETVSLEDLLSTHSAPENIDYLSVDTEGSELPILSSFDFSKYRIAVITVEHNYTPERHKLHELLAGNGFVRKFTEFSKWDDWYVNSNV